MTPAQVATAARNRYNAVNDSFWSDDEVYKIIWEGEQILAQDALVIEAKDTSITTVAGTRTYAFPSLFIAIKRIEYNGTKLMPIDFRQDDLLTLNNASDTTQGTPQYYAIWNDTIYLRAIPDAAQTLTIYGYKQATLLDNTSTTLSTPVRCHSALINYVASIIAAKDQNYAQSDRYMKMWEEDVKRIRSWTMKKKRTDGYGVVRDEESLSETMLGAV